MTLLRFSAFCGFAAVLAGCTREATFTEPLPPLAGIHWINAVPDTGQQDIRVIDIVSNAGLFDANFRGSNMFYQRIEAGSRTVRIFNSSTDPVIASQILQETTVPVTANASYTFIHAGFARTGGTPARAVLIIPDTPPTPAAGQVAVRAINAGAGLGNVDVFVVRKAVNPATADSLPDVRAATNIAFGAQSAYIPVAVDDTTTALAQAMRVVFTTAGTKTVLASITAPAGVFGTTVVNPIAGSRIAGSVLTAVLVPRSVAGSQAEAPPGAVLATPSAVYLVDRRPPNTAP